jgi:CheY-like chemotaxis protein
MSKILCIEDRPEMMFGAMSLEEHIRGLYEKTFEVLPIQKDPEQALRVIMEDCTSGSPQITLVLLDIDFNGDPLGAKIADDIKAVNPNIRIIVLTDKDEQGHKIRFGHKANVWKYFLKDNLLDAGMKIKLLNLSEALINDPDNKRWDFRLHDNDAKMILTSEALNQEVVVDIPARIEDEAMTALEKYSQQPNECLHKVDIFPSPDNVPMNEILYYINDAVREATGWRIWGILSRRNCGAGATRMVIGKVAGQDETASVDGQGVLAMLQTKMAELEKRVEKLEQK